MLTLSLSPYIVTIVASLAVAQLIKYVTASIRTGSFSSWRQLYASGSMPSAHSASVISLVVMVGLLDGTESGLFGLALLFSIIVMYDAIMVRRSVGEQGGEQADHDVLRRPALQPHRVDNHVEEDREGE